MVPPEHNKALQPLDAATKLLLIHALYNYDLSIRLHRYLVDINGRSSPKSPSHYRSYPCI